MPSAAMALAMSQSLIQAQPCGLKMIPIRRINFPGSLNICKAAARLPQIRGPGGDAQGDDEWVLATE